MTLWTVKLNPVADPPSGDRNKASTHTAMMSCSLAANS